MCCLRLNCLANALGQREHLYLRIGPDWDSSELEVLLAELALEPSLSILIGLSMKTEVSIMVGESVDGWD